MTRFRQTFDQMLARQNIQKPRRHPQEKEHHLQTSCVNWFRYQYPQYRHNLFAVPNGGRRDKVTGAKMKEEGVLAGVADLILLKSNAQYGALLIEMKDQKGRQSESQKEWQQLIEADGYKYVICRSFEDFVREVASYLSSVSHP